MLGTNSAFSACPVWICTFAVIPTSSGSFSAPSTLTGTSYTITPPCRLPCSGTSPTCPRSVCPGNASNVICAGCPAVTRRIVVSSTDASTCNCCRFASVKIDVFAAMLSPALTLVCSTVPSNGAASCVPANAVAASCTASRFLSTSACAVASSTVSVPSSSFARASFAAARLTSAALIANCALATSSSVPPFSASASFFCASANAARAWTTCAAADCNASCRSA